MKTLHDYIEDLFNHVIIIISVALFVEAKLILALNFLSHKLCMVIVTVLQDCIFGYRCLYIATLLYHMFSFEEG